MRHKPPRGQGLLELVFAIGIIVAAVVTTLGLVIATTAASNASKTQVIATNLAREGIEIARGVRDTNWLKIDSGVVGTAWNDGLFLLESGLYDFTATALFSPPGPTGDGEWTLSFAADTITAPLAVVYRHPVTGLYSQISDPAQLDCPTNGLYCGYEATQFRRLITTNPICWPMGVIPGSPNPDELITDDGANQPCIQPGYDQAGIQITSRVEWTERGRSRSTTLIEKMFNWKP